MKQTSLFDLKEGRQRREVGMELAAGYRPEPLEIARQGAMAAALRRPGRTATADDAMRYLVKLGYDPSELGNAAGSIFKDGNWTSTGRFQRSVRVSNNARFIMVWQLTEGGGWTMKV